MTERYVTLAEVRDLLEEVAESRKGTAGMLEDEDVLMSCLFYYFLVPLPPVAETYSA